MDRPAYDGLQGVDISKSLKIVYIDCCSVSSYGMCRTQPGGAGVSNYSRLIHCGNATQTGSMTVHGLTPLTSSYVNRGATIHQTIDAS